MSGISLGTQLEAREGFGSLVKGVTYYFLRSRANSDSTSEPENAGWVLLLEFLIRPPREVTYKSAKRPKRSVSLEPFTRLVAVPREDFEEGIFSGDITKSAAQANMPPWLAELDGLNLAEVDGERSRPKKSHSERIDEKLVVIHPLVQQADRILDAKDPDHIINCHARAMKKNETRVRCWFYAYIVFGRNRFALHYPIHRPGKWDRDRGSKVKRGRPSLEGKMHGYNTTPDMKSRIETGYRRECGLGVGMTDVYVKSMKKDFGCRTREVTNGKYVTKEIYHPEGNPFPQLGVFIYHANKIIGPDKVKETLIGKVAMRSGKLPSRGSFTQHTCNLMQHVERDAYAVGELAKGLVEGSPLPPLHVARKRDVRSGYLTGMGFTQGGERSSGYRAATFCEAIGKVKFCALFGIHITEDKWVNRGISPADIQDRGPGATPGADSRNSDLKPVINEMAPSYSGQSKAVVESSNPKTSNNLEAPSFVQSQLRTFELARREIFRLLKFNATCDVSDRITPDISDKIERPGPNGLYLVLDSLGRNDAVQISFEDAVRGYLDKIPARLTRDGVFLHGQLYKSPALSASRACSSISGNTGKEVQIYFLEACIRHIWFDWEGRLIELDLQFPVPVSNEILYMSLEELKEFEAFCKARERNNKKHRLAVTMDTYNDFMETIGKEWDSGSRVQGRPKRGTKAAKQEAAEAKNATRGRSKG